MVTGTLKEWIRDAALALLLGLGLWTGKAFGFAVCVYIMTSGICAILGWPLVPFWWTFALGLVFVAWPVLWRK